MAMSLAEGMALQVPGVLPAADPSASLFHIPLLALWVDPWVGKRTGVQRGMVAFRSDTEVSIPCLFARRLLEALWWLHGRSHSGLESRALRGDIFCALQGNPVLFQGFLTHFYVAFKRVYSCSAPLDFFNFFFYWTSWQCRCFVKIDSF